MKQDGSYTAGAFLAFLKQQLDGRAILIAGFGREGQSSLRWLKTLLPAHLIGLADLNKDSIPVEMQKDFKVFTGKDYLRSASGFDVVLRAPGIPDREIRQIPGAPDILSQSALFLAFFAPLCIGITGTKGKSTTSVLVRDMLRESGMNAILAGNIGLPPFDAIQSLQGQNDSFVLELSAHQLLDIHRGPRIACILNLFEEHLDHFERKDAYFQAKWAIGKHQKEGDILVLNLADPQIMAGISQLNIRASIKSIPALPVNEAYSCIRMENQNGAEDISLSFRSLPAFRGIHLQQNALTAAFISLLAGASKGGIEKALMKFEGLPHRLQYVGEKNGVRFYDDAIATVPEATVQALKSIEETSGLMLGGRDRGIDYGQLIQYLLAHPLKYIFCSGPAGLRIKTGLEAEAYEGALFFDLRFTDALQRALTSCKSGDTLLLSPAAPSYDEFSNFVEKGIFFQTKTGNRLAP